MDIKINVSGKLDFSDIDLTPPEEVVTNVLSQLPKVTHQIVLGKVEPYSGEVFSYTKERFGGLAHAFETSEEVDIQDSLGKIGEETHKFECYLYTPAYEKYKYRVFFMKYGTANYPVTITLEESIAKSISEDYLNYIFICNTKEIFENLLVRVFNSKRIIEVMQELIRINQSQREKQTEIPEEKVLPQTED